MSSPEGNTVFLDEETAESLHWREVWQWFSPVTPYGCRLKKSLQATRPGEETVFAANAIQLASDAKALRAEHVERLRSRLAAVPDALEAVEALRAHGTTLSHRQLLTLKQVAVAGRALAKEPVVVQLGWTSDGEWQPLIRSFGDDTSPTFALPHLGSHAYALAAEAYRAAVAQVAQAARVRDEGLLQAYGKRPNRDGQIVIPVPHERDIAESLKAADTVRWLRDTPFDSVFEALPTRQMNAATQALETAQTALDREAALLLRQLTDEIRAQAPLWLRGQEALAQLDVRIAKVHFLRRIRGSVPVLGHRVSMENGVHPVVDERLRSTERAFIPLRLAPEDGVNVICGSNMGGKTVALHTLALCQALAQFGLPVPSARFETRLFDCVRVCASADTDAHSGLSSFGSEVARLVDVWEPVAQGRIALLCIDEPGRSTNPFEGEALVVGLVRSLTERARSGVVSLIATHFAAPIQERGIAKFRVRGIRPDALNNPAPPALGLDRAASAKRIAFLERAMSYEIERMEDDEVPHEALRVAEWLGAPDVVLRHTRTYLNWLSESRRS